MKYYNQAIAKDRGEIGIISYISIGCEKTHFFSHQGHIQTHFKMHKQTPHTCAQICTCLFLCYKNAIAGAVECVLSAGKSHYYYSFVDDFPDDLLGNADGVARNGYCLIDEHCLVLP